MAAIMPTGTGGNQSSNPYDRYDAPVEDDLIDPDDGTSTLPLESSNLL
jgi:hypothetical protein